MMLIQVNETLLQEAISQWGQDAQIDMAVEECSELLVSLMQGRRGRSVNPAEEIADVIIMMCQLALIFDVETVQGYIDLKQARLQERLGINHD